MPETEEKPSSETEGNKLELGGHSKKEKALLWWGLGIAGAGLLATLLLFKKQPASQSVSMPSVNGPGTAIPTARYGSVPSFVPNPQNPYNASANDYWPLPAQSQSPTQASTCPATGCTVTPNQTTQPAGTVDNSQNQTQTQPSTYTPPPASVQQQPDTNNQGQNNQTQGIDWANFGQAPAPQGTPGMSNNFYQYFTQYGETLNSLATKFNWQNQGGANQVLNYRNNAAIFRQAGVNDANQPIPPGTLISA